MTDRTILTWPGPQEILSQPGALKRQTGICAPFKLTTAPFVLSRPSLCPQLLAGMWGPGARRPRPGRRPGGTGGSQRRSLSPRKQFPHRRNKAGACCRSRRLCLFGLRPRRWGGRGRPGDAELGAAASPFGTSILLPWVSHFVQHGN